MVNNAKIYAFNSCLMSFPCTLALLIPACKTGKLKCLKLVDQAGDLCFLTPGKTNRIWDSSIIGKYLDFHENVYSSYSDTTIR